VPEIIREGCELTYTVDGPPEAPVLLLSNALGTTRELWRAQVPALASMFRVVRYHTRGHGDSQGSPGEYTLDALGRDALAILDAIGTDRADIGGLSLGGMTAMWVGIHAPHRVRRLILADTAARIATSEYWQQRIDEVRSHGLAAVARAAPGRWFSEPFQRQRPDIVAVFQEMLRSCPPAGYAACAAALRDADLSEAVARIPVPVLVIAGKRDPVTPPSDAEWLCAHLSAARRVDLNAAHLSNVEAARPFTQAVLEFLAG
jgi:3-oxoadipate enol-lactonase